MNMAKPSEVIQRESESPSEFYKRLCETYRLYRSRGFWVSDGDKRSLCVSSLPRKCQMGGHQGIHEFLYIPECPIPLLGKDSLSKLGAQVTFPPTKDPTVRVGSTTYLLFHSVTPQDEWRLHDLLEGKPDRLNSRERDRVSSTIP